MLAELNINTVLLAGGVLFGAGFVFVLILNVAYARLKVEQDPKVEAILGILPGANCGGCGFAGCGAYAEAVVADPSLIGKCGPGGAQVVEKTSEILGVAASASAPLKAVVHCSAKRSDKTYPANYVGAKSCTEAQLVAGVLGCPSGCLGMGDCVVACEFDAIHIVDGLAVVDYDKCVGCGACVKACPRGIIELIGMEEDPLMVIACASHDKAKDVRGYCQVGCVGCGLCAKMAPGMFVMKEALPVIDYDKYGDKEARDKAQGKCPRSMIIYVGANVAGQQSEAGDKGQVA